ncbi:uncharacterized protein LOC119161772 isoform X2 [Rhipicephalus microplus]|uniref:uncharacterized protein LOC119161772 isoform X2 n=1 Tax=Rhipicephalus microplus TaxID=6941 RepID=UPI003F6B0C18
MPESPLLLAQILSWFIAVLPTANNWIELEFSGGPQRGYNTADHQLDNAYPAGVMSPLKSLQKARPFCESPLLFAQLRWSFGVRCQAL